MPDSEVRRNLELVGTAAGVAAVLLPLGGLLVRVVAFWSINAEDRREIILGDSIPSLALSGFEAVLSSLGFMLVLVLIYRASPVAVLLRATTPKIRRLRADNDAIKADLSRVESEVRSSGGAIAPGSEADSKLQEIAKRSTDLGHAIDDFEASEEWKQFTSRIPKGFFERIMLSAARPPNRVSVIASAILGAALLLFLPGWPSALPLFIAWAIVAFAAPWLASYGIFARLASVFLATALVIALSAIGSGLSGSTGSEYLADYEFKPDANLVSGRYEHIAESNGELWLQDCLSMRIVAVEMGSVAHIDESTYIHAPDRPSLWDVLINGRQWTIGYRTEC